MNYILYNILQYFLNIFDDIIEWSGIRYTHTYNGNNYDDDECSNYSYLSNTDESYDNDESYDIDDY